MVFDSPLLLVSAAALFAACVAAWHLSAGLKSPARLPLRFAAMLLASLAVASMVRLGDVAALLLLPLASVALAQAALARFARACPPLVASLALAAALACGIIAILFGAPLPALLILVVAALVVIAASLNRMALVPVLSGAALLMVVLMAMRAGASAGVLLACAASVIGLTRGQPLRSTKTAWRGAALP